MKPMIRSILGLALALAVTPLFAVDVDPKPLPKLDAILAAVQARAAKRMEESRAEGLAARPSNEAGKSVDVSLRQGAHVQESTLHDRIDTMLENRRTQAPESIPSFVMRADGRPLGGVFSKGSQGLGSKQLCEMVGCIKIDHDSEDVPQFKVYFEGMETTNNDEGFFKFPVDCGNIEKYAIIICNKIKHTFGGHNTVDSFGLIPDMNYRYFYFKRNKDGSSGWTQQEKDLRRRNLRIPRNAIVITVNPVYFDRLETTWPGDYGSSTLKLPRIVFKAGHRAKLERKAIKSLLHGLDMSPFHTDVKHVSREIGDGKGEVSVRFAQ